MEDFLMIVLTVVMTNVVAILFVLSVTNWVTKGLFFKYVKVFASRGSLILVEIITSVNNYFVCGKVIEGFLVFVDKSCDKGQKKRIPLKEGVVSRWLGVNKISFDEKSNNFFNLNGGMVDSWDASMLESLHDRALKKPTGGVDMRMILIIAILVVVILVIVIFCTYQVFTLKDAVALIECMPKATVI